jgi:hypothetical protein
MQVRLLLGAPLTHRWGTVTLTDLRKYLIEVDQTSLALYEPYAPSPEHVHFYRARAWRADRYPQYGYRSVDAPARKSVIASSMSVSL